MTVSCACVEPVSPSDSDSGFLCTLGVIHVSDAHAGGLCKIAIQKPTFCILSGLLCSVILLT